LNNCKTILCTELGPAQCYSTNPVGFGQPVSSDRAQRAEPPLFRPLPAPLRCRRRVSLLPRELHAPPMPPPVSEASSRRRAVVSRVRQPLNRPPPNGRRRSPAATTTPRAARVAIARAPYPHHRSGGKNCLRLFPHLPSSSHPTAQARHRRRALATVDRHLRSSSSHTYSTPSTARVPGTSTSTSTPVSSPSPVCRRRLFPARARRRRELPSVSLPPPFTSNRSHHQPGPLSSRFPADQRRPVGRISPASRQRRGGGGFFLPCFPRVG
jgi:hypothetical protein